MPRLASRVGMVSLIVAVAIGLAAGMGGFTLVYARGGSYLFDDPAACANCHVMREQLDAWTRASHHTVAGCNDCHTPKNFFLKYVHKARNGWHHSVAFTGGGFHEPIRIGPVNRRVTEQRCRECHAPIVSAIDAHSSSTREPISCIRCHRDVGHAH